MDREGRGFGKSERPWIVREGRSEKAEVPWIDKGEVSGNAKASGIAPSGLGENQGVMPRIPRALPWAKEGGAVGTLGHAGNQCLPTGSPDADVIANAQWI